MEFLAESIGLLDLDSSSRAYVAPAPENNTATPTNTSTNSILFGSWGSTETRAPPNSKSKEKKPANENDDDDAAIRSEERRSISNKTTRDTSSSQQASQKLNSSFEEDELEQYLFHETDNNNESCDSLLSSLSLNSPLTLSASSLNFKTCNQSSDDALPANNINNSSSVNNQQYGETIITKTTTHRLTPQGSFSGNIDAITGHFIHGTFISNQFGTVYEGSFACNGRGESVRHGFGECVYPVYDFVSTINTMRSSSGEKECGSKKECGSIKFVGRYEWDTPKTGIWFGNEWVYEGYLSSLHEIEQQQQQQLQQQHNDTLLGASSQHKRKGVIGISKPLPDNVLFHGTGRFMRKDGYIYQGEFVAGLACGVGKEILPENKGVYYGEFLNGLRHGVGTLIDYTYDEEDGAAVNDQDLDCTPCAFNDGQEDGCAHHSQHHVQDGSMHSINLEDDTENSSNDGPDFAAGGLYNSLSTTTSDHHEAFVSQTGNVSTENTSNVHLQQSASCTTNQSNQQGKTKHPKNRNRILKQRYSSGVWIAGQYEIEDSRCFMQNNNQEEVDTGDQISRDEDNKVSASSSLNRTTWDLLDEKWLGLG